MREKHESSNFSRISRSPRNATGNVLAHRARTSGRYLGENREHGRVSVLSETVLSSLGPRRGSLVKRIRAVCARSVKKFAFGVGRYNSRERSLFCITSSAGAEIYDRSHLSCRESSAKSSASLPGSPRRGISSLARSQPQKLAGGSRRTYHCVKLEIF